MPRKRSVANFAMGRYPIATVFCPRCGNNNDNNARFCFSCGQRFQQGSQPAGPSGPQWGQFQDPAPAPPPTPRPAAPPQPPPPSRPVNTQIVAAPPAKKTNPALAVAILAGLAIIIGAVFFITKGDNKGGGPFGAGEAIVGADLPTQTAAGPTPGATKAPALADGPVV